MVATSAHAGSDNERSPPGASPSAWTTQRSQMCHVTPHRSPPHWGQGSSKRTAPAGGRQMYENFDI